MSETLLESYTVCLFQPFPFSFQNGRKIFGHLDKTECITPLSPQSLLLFKVIVIHEAATAEGLFKELLLLLIWICPILISSDALHDTPPNICSYYTMAVDIEIEISCISLYFFQSLVFRVDRLIRAYARHRGRASWGRACSERMYTVFLLRGVRFIPLPTA